MECLARTVAGATPLTGLRVRVRLAHLAERDDWGRPSSIVSQTACFGGPRRGVVVEPGLQGKPCWPKFGRPQPRTPRCRRR